MRKLSFLTLPLVTLLTGCAYSLHPYSPPTDVKLQLPAARTEGFAIRVTATVPPSDNPVTPEGRVTFTVPPFRRGCSTYLCGVLRIADATPERTRVVEVRREPRVVRKLSLSQITKLPRDAAGYGVLEVND